MQEWDDDAVMAIDYWFKGVMSAFHGARQRETDPVLERARAAVGFNLFAQVLDACCILLPGQQVRRGNCANWTSQALFFAGLLERTHMFPKATFVDLFENLVLDHRGYLKVVDLGLAKIVDGKTWTLCGTPDYLAPEIILNEGHDKGVDYWALGVLIYELVSGIPPFYADDPMEVYEKILSSNMTFPSHFTKNMCDICKKLLKLCQSKRLGNGKGGCTGVLKHKWFSGFDWDGLLQKCGLCSVV